VAMLLFWVLTLFTVVWIPTFRRNMLHPSSGLNMQKVCFCETLTSTYETTRCQNPEEQCHPQSRKKLYSSVSQTSGNRGPLQRSVYTRTTFVKFPTPKTACKSIGGTLYQWLKLL
jgi:hypothetical protein